MCCDAISNRNRKRKEDAGKWYKCNWVSMKNRERSQRQLASVKKKSREYGRKHLPTFLSFTGSSPSVFTIAAPNCNLKTQGSKNGVMILDAALRFKCIEPTRHSVLAPCVSTDLSLSLSLSLSLLSAYLFPKLRCNFVFQNEPLKSTCLLVNLLHLIHT